MKSRFAKEWEETGDRLLRFPPASLAGVELDSASRRFLRDVGLSETIDFLEGSLRKIDPAAFLQGAFWPSEIDALREMSS